MHTHTPNVYGLLMKSLHWRQKWTLQKFDKAYLSSILIPPQNFHSLLYVQIGTRGNFKFNRCVCMLNLNHFRLPIFTACKTNTHAEREIEDKHSHSYSFKRNSNIPFIFYTIGNGENSVVKKCSWKLYSMVSWFEDSSIVQFPTCISIALSTHALLIV